MCQRNKVLETLGYVRIFTYLGAANITSKQKSDMTKVAIKNENITSFGGIYIIFFVVFQTSPLVWVGDFMLRKDPKNTEAPHINI